MPEAPVATGAVSDDSPAGGSSGGGTAAVGTGTEEVVPKERFDGLMATMNREQEARKQAEARARALEEQLKGESIKPELSDEMRKYVDTVVGEAKRETQTVFSSLKSAQVKTLLQKYPYATEDVVTGATPEEWETSAKAEHERVKAIVDKEAAVKAEEAEANVRKMYGAPLSVGGPAAQPTGQADFDSQLKQARERGDMQEATRLLLLKPIISEE